MGLQAHRDEQPLDGRGVMRDLVIGVGTDFGRVLQSVERRFAGQSGTVRALPRQCSGEHAEHRIMAQLIVVVDILIAERDAEDALAEQRWQRVDGGIQIAAILEAARQPRHQPDRFVGLAQQQRARVRADLPAIEGAHNLAALDSSEIERILATLCRHRGEPRARVKSLLHNNFRRVAAPMLLLTLRNGG
jgi:hypothetical protein